MPKPDEIPKRLGVRAVVVHSSNNFLLTLQDILNPDLSFIFGKLQVIKQYSRFLRFLSLRQINASFIFVTRLKTWKLYTTLIVYYFCLTYLSVWQINASFIFVTRLKTWKLCKTLIVYYFCLTYLSVRYRDTFQAHFI